jgi:hypothetical protein
MTAWLPASMPPAYAGEEEAVWAWGWFGSPQHTTVAIARAEEGEGGGGQIASYIHTCFVAAAAAEEAQKRRDI